MGDVKVFLDEASSMMQKSIEYFQLEMQKLRLGSVNIEAIKNISVEIYGSHMPIFQVATISSPGAASVIITPWDKGSLQPIASAVETEFRGEINPNVKDGAVYVNFPAITQEKKEEYVKLLKEKSEHFRQQIRDHRQESKNAIEDMKKNGEVSEDIVFKALEDLDELTKKMTEEINNHYEAKKAQILK
jgi:ribosome recycling factor